MFAEVQLPLMDKWTVVITLVSDLLLLLTLFVFAYQARELRIAQEQQLTYSIEELKIRRTGDLQEFFLGMFKDPSLANVWEMGRSGKKLNESQQLQFKWACVYWFEHIASLYSLYEKNLITAKDFEGWKKTLVDDFKNDRKPGLIHWWGELEDDYEASFREWIHEIVGETLVCSNDCHHCQVVPERHS